MPNCTEERELLGVLGRRRIEVGFDGGEVSSDAGLLLRQAERKLGLLKAAAQVLPDPRNPDLIVHTTEQLLRQRVFGLCQGYEDLNDHDQLRLDPALQTALDKRGKTATDQYGASSPTLCRFEARANRKAVVDLHRVLVEQFIASLAEPPQELILDFDATDDPMHGQQNERHFSAYYNRYSFLPLYVFCGEQLLVAYLRSAKHDAALHAAAIMKLLTRRLRRAWPAVHLVFRGDSGFCRDRQLSWCERNDVDYIVGLRKNSRQGRTQRAGRQPAVHPDLVARSATGCLRMNLLRARRDGEPYQGMPARPVCRPHQLPSVVAQSMPSAAGQSRLRAHGAAAQCWPRRYRVGSHGSARGEYPAISGARCAIRDDRTASCARHANWR